VASTILLLAYYYPPQNTSGAARPGRFAKYLPAFGHSVVVLSADDDACATISGDLPANWRMPMPGFVQRLEGLAIALLQKILKEHSQRLPWMAAAVPAGRAIVEQLGCTAILSTSPPLSTHLTALRLKKHHPNLKWIADFRDPFVDSPFRNTPFHKLYDARAERTFFEHADVLIANTDVVAENWKKRYPEFAAKIHVIWNGFDPAEGMAPAEPVRRPYRVLLHAGDIYGRRHPGEVLAAIDRLQRKGALTPGQVRIELIGPLDPQSALHSFPAFQHLHRQGCLYYNGKVVPQPEAQQAMQQADFLLLLDVNDRHQSLQVPAKIFDYIRTGRPILATTPLNSPAARILAGSGIPHTCLHFGDTEEQVDAKLLRFLRQPSSVHPPSPWFFENFDAHRQTAVLATLLRENPSSP